MGPHLRKLNFYRSRFCYFLLPNCRSLEKETYFDLLQLILEFLPSGLKESTSALPRLMWLLFYQTLSVPDFHFCLPCRGVTTSFDRQYPQADCIIFRVSCRLYIIQMMVVNYYLWNVDIMLCITSTHCACFLRGTPNSGREKGGEIEMGSLAVPCSVNASYLLANSTIHKF